MSERVADKALEFAFARTTKKLQLGFFGGEPLMEWTLLQRSTERAEELAEQAGIKLVPTLTTNASLVTKERADWLAAHRFFPAVSMDGNRAMHDATRPLSSGDSSFDAVYRGLQLVRDHFSRFDVVVVIDPANIMHLTESIRFLADEVRVPRISINPNFYIDWPEAALEQWTRAFNALGDFYMERFRAGAPLSLTLSTPK